MCYAPYFFLYVLFTRLDRHAKLLTYIALFPQGARILPNVISAARSDIVVSNF